jgi:hypothetical protein
MAAFSLHDCVPFRVGGVNEFSLKFRQVLSSFPFLFCRKITAKVAHVSLLFRCISKQPTFRQTNRRRAE